jgi:hypothetical protein
MSSTNRTNAKDRHIADYYVTPQSSIREFLEAFNEDFPRCILDEPITILDPCAGGDKKHEMSYPAAIEKYSGWKFSGIETVDVRNDSRATLKEDFLFKNFGSQRYDMAITNPPFNIALDVIQKCLTLVNGGGWVIMLLRLNFFGSQERSAWFKNCMPTVCYVHSKRLKFTDDGGTDSIEYVHMCWKVGEHPKFTSLRIL